MKRVLCISDSLGLPRLGVDYSQTWIAMLRTQIQQIDFIGLGRRSGTTDMFSESNYGEYLWYYKPDEIILQLGICDCSPRYMRTTSLMYRLMRKVPRVIQMVFWHTYKTFVKRSLKRTDVPLSRFKQNLENYLLQCQAAGVSRVICIKIATPGPAMLEANPLVAESVRRYNVVYDMLTQSCDFIVVIDPLHIGDDKYYVDGYHANALGNRAVANAIIRVLSNPYCSHN